MDRIPRRKRIRNQPNRKSTDLYPLVRTRSQVDPMDSTDTGKKDDGMCGWWRRWEYHHFPDGKAVIRKMEGNRILEETWFD